MTEEQLDDLLNRSFSEALDAVEHVDVSTAVLRTLRRRERLRLAVLLFAGCLATSVCVVAGMPLLVGSFDWVMQSFTQPDWSTQLAAVPAVGILVAMMALCGWVALLVEEPI